MAHACPSCAVPGIPESEVLLLRTVHALWWKQGPVAEDLPVEVLLLLPTLTWLSGVIVWREILATAPPRSYFSC